MGCRLGWPWLLGVGAVPGAACADVLGDELMVIGPALVGVDAGAAGDVGEVTVGVLVVGVLVVGAPTAAPVAAAAPPSAGATAAAEGGWPVLVPVCSTLGPVPVS
ncbi:MAG: hypothetical protein M3381_11700 [Actinomycetota bacterium]|nr:hypothetical protein [Actinomycetota bacterium]